MENSFFLLKSWFSILTKFNLKHKKLEIPLSKIKDARFTTGKEITFSRGFWLGVMGVIAFKKKHKLLTIDFDESGKL
jgi:hypothetical protein